ncbi:hypothetical protein BH11BAC4_BH11BAC4_25290 [soil metagenome]
MKRKNVFSLLSVAIIISAVAASCNNNDTTDSMSTTTTDSASTMMSTDTSKMMADTAKMMTTDTSMNKMATDNKGMAKPNPAKKGLKGKVSIAEKPAVKSTGAMEADAGGVYSNVEVIPSFPGGYKGLQKFFDDNLEYPTEASNDGVEGTVNVTFVVDENGKLTSPGVGGEKLGYGLESEALRVVNKMPTWNPGKLKGKNVKTTFTLPVKFVLY